MNKPSRESIVETPAPLPIYLPLSELAARESYFSSSKRDAFFEYFDRAQAGSSPAQATLAMMYLNNYVLGVDRIEYAEYWATKSADADDEYGRWVLAWVYLEKLKLTEGIEQMVLSAEKSFAPAIYNLGLFLVNGVGFDKDVDSGLRFVRRAAQIGHHGSKIFLINYYKAGRAGLLRKLIAFGLLQFGEIFDPIVRILPGNLFGPSRLSYYRQVNVQNELRRQVQGEQVGRQLDDQIDKLFGR